MAYLSIWCCIVIPSWALTSPFPKALFWVFLIFPTSLFGGSKLCDHSLEGYSPGWVDEDTRRYTRSTALSLGKNRKTKLQKHWRQFTKSMQSIGKQRWLVSQNASYLLLIFHDVTPSFIPGSILCTNNEKPISILVLAMVYHCTNSSRHKAVVETSQWQANSPDRTGTALWVLPCSLVGVPKL